MYVRAAASFTHVAAPTTIVPWRPRRSSSYQAAEAAARVHVDVIMFSPLVAPSLPAVVHSRAAPADLTLRRDARLRNNCLLGGVHREAVSARAAQERRGRAAHALGQVLRVVVVVVVVFFFEDVRQRSAALR